MPTESAVAPESRRDFFKYLVNGIGGAIAAILAVPLGGLYVLPSLRKPKVVWKRVGTLSSFPIGEIRLAKLEPLERREWPEDWGAESAWVYRRSDRDLVVYNIHCTHVGCPVKWSRQAKRFFSPCHGGVFDREGRVLAGPPPRPLDRYEVRIDQGVVYAGPVYTVDARLERTS